jgi:hypothetical protein
MELEIMMFSEISQSHKDSISYFLSLVQLGGSKENKAMKIKEGITR